MDIQGRLAASPVRLLYAFTVPRPVLFPQGKLLYFAGSRLRQFGEKFHRFWGFKVGHMIAAEGNQFLCARLLPRFEDDERFRRFAPGVIRDADYGSFQHCWMLVQHGFDFY
jgi:hypothetical protein